MNDCDAKDLIEFAKRWAALGDAVTEQVEQVVHNPNCGNCWGENAKADGVNPSAIRTAAEILQGLCDELDEVLATFLGVNS